MFRFSTAALFSIALVGCSNGDIPVQEETRPVASVQVPVGSSSAAVVETPLAGSATSADAQLVEPAPSDGPRIYCKRRHAWIFYEPRAESGWMGFLGLGGSVKLKSKEPRTGSGCPAFYAVEPRGYVCLNDKTTLDFNDPEYQAIRFFAPKLGTPFPHEYGESRGLPRFITVPPKYRQFKEEYRLKDHLAMIEKLRSGEIKTEDAPKLERGVDTSLAGIGFFEQLKLIGKVQEEREYLKPESTVAWSRQFDAEGRTWLVTGDIALVPKDKVTPYPKSDFRGVHLKDGVKLPIVFIRKQPRPKYKLEADGSVVATGESWPRLGWFQLGEGSVAHQDKTYLKTQDGLLIDEDDATVLRPNPVTPWGVPVEGASGGEKKRRLTSIEAPKGGRETWVEISVESGWMIAYEGARPVYATLISPGRGGIPTRGVDPLETASTPTGTFRIDGKFATAMMANNAFVHSDVPYAQNFHGPHALHMAYWHDRWGEKKSAGCINLSPNDALWFYGWTEPSVPEGWHGLRSDKQAGPATAVWVHQ